MCRPRTPLWMVRPRGDSRARLAAPLTELPFAAAVGRVLELYQDVVGVPERQLLGRRVGVGAHPDRCLHAVLREALHHPGGIELLDAEAEVIDPARLLAGREREKLRTFADADDRDDLLLPVRFCA